MIERRMKIIRDYSSEGKISVVELAVKYHVSQVTIRNDLCVLQEAGLIRRIHGGASSIADEFKTYGFNINYNTKLRIAERAVQMVNSGETIIIESGSTNALFAKMLGQTKQVTIITNSNFIANYVRDIPNIDIVLLGGNYQTDSTVCVGPLTRHALQNFYVDKFFVGTDGYSDEVGFTCINLLHAETISAMAKRSTCSIILTDSSKFNQRGVVSQLSLPEVSMVITDDKISGSARSALERSGILVITVR